MRSSVALWLGALATSGCGLVVDLDPPALRAGMDGGRRDGGRPDAAARDAGSRDAAVADGARPDAAVIDGGARSDAAVADGGVRPDGGSGCASASDCGANMYCHRPRGLCFGLGECRLRPRSCPDLHDPVCGCDWAVYGNACEANLAGVNVMQDETCPVPQLGEWCSLAPPTVMHPAGCRFCFDDDDCRGSLAPYCVSASCRADGAGVCAFLPGLGDCYDQRQCRADERCLIGVIDRCYPTQGRCAAIARP